MALVDARLSFRAMTREDLTLLSEWLATPHVSNWWREEFDLAAIEARYGPVIDGRDPTECFIVERDGHPVGFIQRYLFSDDPDWQRILAPAGTPDDAAGIDYFIGSPSLIGQGLGTQIIDRFVGDMWTRYPAIAAVVVDVSVDNRPSWRALEKAGFSRAWTGALDSDDPSDAGLNHVYLRRRDQG